MRGEYRTLNRSILSVYSLVILFLSVSMQIFAQDHHVVDSLQNELNKYEAIKQQQATRYTNLMDSTKAGILIRLSSSYWNNDPDKARDYAQQGLTLSERIGYKKGIGNALSSLGIVYRNKGDYPVAMNYLEKSLKIREEIKDRQGIAASFNNMGLCYTDQGNYPEALKYHLNALKIREQLNDKSGMATSYNNVGICYINQGDYANALKYHLDGLKINTEIDNREGIGNAFNNLATVYNYTRKYAESLEYYKKALQVRKEIGDKRGMSVTLGNIGHMYYGAGDNTAGLKNILEALSLQKEIGDKHGMVITLYNIAEIHSRQNKFNEAIQYASQGLSVAREIGALDWVKLGYEGLAEINFKMDNYKVAYENEVLFKQINDSIFNSENTKKITRLQVQYEFTKKEDSINLQQVIATEKFKQHQKQLELKLSLANKEQELQKLAYLKTQADLQNEQLEKREAGKQLEITKKEKELEQTKVKGLSQQQALSKLERQQQWIYIIGGLILLGSISFYIFYRARLQQARLKNQMAAEKIEQQQKESEFQRRLGDISLSALRSQMNPHFIFNCLNSIKLYTTQNDTVAASEYLTKFSRLIRLVLENSRNDRISLASELDALRLYIEMEAMRFKEKLQYDILVEKNVDMDYIEIPPLLLQPYVENAIWHGLMQKEEGGRIDINVAIQSDESILLIAIMDNGIGRAKSSELMSKTATKHKSYGMKVTSERLALINQVYKTGANVVIDDLIDDRGEPCGTRVTIKIPLE